MVEKERKEAAVNLLIDLGLISENDGKNILRYLLGRASLKYISKNMTVDEGECIKEIIVNKGEMENK